MTEEELEEILKEENSDINEKFSDFYIAARLIAIDPRANSFKVEIPKKITNHDKHLSFKINADFFKLVMWDYIPTEPRGKKTRVTFNYYNSWGSIENDDGSTTIEKSIYEILDVKTLDLNVPRGALDDLIQGSNYSKVKNKYRGAVAINNIGLL